MSARARSVSNRSSMAPRGPSTWPTVAGWLTAAALFVVAAFSAVGVLADGARADGTDDGRGPLVEARHYELLGLRARLAWVHFDLLTDGLDRGRAGSAVGRQRLEEFHRLRDEAIAELNALGRSQEVDPTIAAAISDLLAGYRDEPFQSWPYPAEELDVQHYHSLDRAAEADVSGPYRKLVDAVFVTMLPRLVLADALAVEYSTQPTEQPVWAVDYLDRTLDTVTNAPGWLGPDGNRPLAGNAVSGGVMPDLVGAADRSDLDAIWRYDQWLIEGSAAGFGRRPPTSIESLRSHVLAASDDLRTATLAALDDTEAEAEAAAARRSEAGGGLILALISGTVAVALTLALIGRQRRAHRLLADQLFTDALTGARNRRYLADRIVPACQANDIRVVVAVFDLDRFKLVNDTWGHDVGDLLLVAMTKRLTTVAAELVDGTEAASADVVRLGGDEFAVIIRGSTGHSVAAIEQTLRGVTGPVALGADRTVTLETSVGVIEAQGPADITDLIKGADLATYEDKRARSEAASQTTLATAVVEQ